MVQQIKDCKLKYFANPVIFDLIKRRFFFKLNGRWILQLSDGNNTATGMRDNEGLVVFSNEWNNITASYISSRCLALIQRTAISTQLELYSLQTMPCDVNDRRQLWRVTELPIMAVR